MLHVRVRAGKLVYDIDLERSATILQGDSGIGKSRLVDLVEMSYTDAALVASVECERPVSVFRSLLPDMSKFAEMYAGYLLFVDEGNVSTENLAGLYKDLRKHDIWVVVVTREHDVTYNLECSISSMLTLHASGKYVRSVPLFDIRSSLKYSVVKSEDEGSGYQFYSKLCKTDKPACGKDWLDKGRKSELTGKVLAFDCAVLGPRFSAVYEYYKQGLFDIINIDSFEKLLLTSKLFDHDDNVQRALYDPVGSGANNAEYYSWETFYEKVLNKAMIGKHYGSYKKGILPECFSDTEDIKDILIRNGLESLIYKPTDERVQKLRELLPPSKRDISDVELIEKYGGLI